ncbi:MAG TPA: phosphoribosylamine--glycine ligase [Gemmatimonadaceae bacterium]|nr:phosphoribosylamine--glycine ligase [Gemmatimonadaceae bacterium]
MKVLIIGSGGREHALAWKLSHELPGMELVAAPGNPGIATLARCVPVAATDVDGLVALAERERPDFTLVGPEAPLALGIVDRFRARALPIFGPTRAAASIETSKAFAKQLMLDAGVPTAMAYRHTDVDAAKRSAREFGAPVVVKASGLAAGKGVIVCATLDDADRAIEYMLRDEGFGAAGAEILVEEFMEGEELSVFAITDGVNVVPLVPAQDHKRLLPGDRGPNTGGMGAYAPVSLTVPDAAAGTSTDPDSPMRAAYAVVDRVVAPTLDALRERGAPFTGLLYAGVMVTADGPKVVEFNCRFGDPETQAVLPITGIALAPLFESVARGGTLAGRADFSVSEYAVTTVVAAAGYPERVRTGDVVTIPDADEGVLVFHAGTARDAAGRLVTSGGRVLAVTAVADSIEKAQQRSTGFASRIEFDGKQYRDDIGWREVARRARAT